MFIKSFSCLKNVIKSRGLLVIPTGIAVNWDKMLVFHLIVCNGWLHIIHPLLQN